MPGGDHCAVWGCDNDRRYPEKQIVLPHVGVLRFYSPLSKQDISSWDKAIHRDNFKVTSSTKVCSNHFSAGYRHSERRTPTLYLKGYEEQSTIPSRPPPKYRALSNKKRKQKIEPVKESPKKMKFSDNQAKSFCEEGDVSTTQTSTIDHQSQKRNYFIEQATCVKNCYRYTGISRPKLDLVFSTIKEKANSINYWRGSVDTIKPKENKKRKEKSNEKRVLTKWEEFILTLVRLRKGFDVRFLADTFSINAGQVSRIFNTWVIFLSEELSFLVPWPSRSQIEKNLPKRFKKFQNARVIIDCVELYLQKPSLPTSQKITWSNYKHWNTAKLLIGITPSGIISFIPPLWTGCISNKEIVRNSGLIGLLDEGDAVMADK